MARPAARARLLGLGRLTAPTRSRWVWLALWVAAAAAGFVAQIPALVDRGPPVAVEEVME